MAVRDDRTDAGEGVYWTPAHKDPGSRQDGWGPFREGLKNVMKPGGASVQVEHLPAIHSGSAGPCPTTSQIPDTSIDYFNGLRTTDRMFMACHWPVMGLIASEQGPDCATSSWPNATVWNFR
jgi:hypothetical protein